MLSFSKKKWIWFSFLLVLVLSANVFIYRTDIIKPIPSEVVLASIFDFIIIIPLIIYFFIIRKRYSIKYLLLVAIAGYGLASLIIPKGLLSSYSFVKYILFACEGVFIILELYIIYKLMTKIPSIIKNYRSNETEIPTFQYRMEQIITQHLKPSRILDMILSEITMFYYSFFSWRKKPLSVLSDVRTYTFHQNTSTIAFYMMLIHALVLESVGFHFLLNSWNEAVSIILLLFNIYTLLFILAEIQVIRLCPFIITNRHLYLQVGIMQQLTVPIREIKSIHPYQGPEKLSKDEKKDIFDAVLTDFMKEKPIYEIEFNTPQEVILMYGFKKKVTKAHLRPDEPQKFYDTLYEKLNKVNS